MNIYGECVSLVFSLQNCASYMRDKRTRTMDDTNMDTRNYTSPDSLVLYTRDNCSHKCISFCFFFLHFNHFAISINTFTAFLCLSESGVWLRNTSHQMTMFTTKLALETKLLAFCLSMKVQELFQRRMPTNLMDRIWPFRLIHIKSTLTSMSITPICFHWTPFTLY